MVVQVVCCFLAIACSVHNALFKLFAIDIPPAVDRYPTGGRFLDQLLEAAPFYRRKRIDLTNIPRFARLHSLLPYSYRCVAVAFAYDDL